MGKRKKNLEPDLLQWTPSAKKVKTYVVKILKVTLGSRVRRSGPGPTAEGVYQGNIKIVFFPSQFLILSTGLPRWGLLAENTARWQ